MRRWLFLICLSPLSATVIVKKNGDVVSGRIVQEKEDGYVFRSPYGQLLILKSDISRLILDENSLELKTIRHDNKPVQARLVAEDSKTKIYLTDDGRTIRQQHEEVQLSAVQQAPAPVWRFYLSGSYGWSTHQKIDTAPSANGGMAPLDQSLKPGSLALSLGGYYGLWSHLAFGLSGSFYRTSSEATLNAQPGLISYNSTLAQSAWIVAPALNVSLFGSHRESKQHDLQLEIEPGIAWNSAVLELSIKNPGVGVPSSASADGQNVSFALKTQMSYIYRLTDSFRIRLGVSYTRLFYGSAITSGLKSNPVFPGAFKTDFDKMLAGEAQNPQLILVSLGLEYGF